MSTPRPFDAPIVDRTLNLMAIVAGDIRMAERCYGCNFTICLTPKSDRAAGLCVGCKKPVCFFCGCTDEVPCAIPVIGGHLACEWYAPGCCSVCFGRILKLAYEKVSR